MPTRSFEWVLSVAAGAVAIAGRTAGAGVWAVLTVLVAGAAEALGGRVRLAQAVSARATNPVATIPTNLLKLNIKLIAG